MSSRIIRFRLEHSAHSTLCNVLAEGVFGFNLWGWDYLNVRGSIIPLTMELLRRNENVQYVCISTFDEDKFESGEWMPLGFEQSPITFGPLPIVVPGKFLSFRPVAKGKLDKKAVQYYMPAKPDPDVLLPGLGAYLPDRVYLNRFMFFRDLPTEGPHCPRPN